VEYFVPINAIGLPPEKQLRALRLNCLGSLFYFIKVGLRRKKLTEHLHLPLALSLEVDVLNDVHEWPRDHFKSTLASEGLAMWRVLPFSQQDEDELRTAGYSQDFVNWMRRKHNPDLRTLLVSENLENAAKLGTRIRWHYDSNTLYRALFPETLPDSSSIWHTRSLHIKRPKHTTGGAHGEGTFDFLGVGSALQSRHYTGGVFEDDLVGRKAIESPSVMDKTIDYHRLIVGAFEDDRPGESVDELVIGNRWGFHDLNSWIRENESWFRFHTHSALGGCCAVHPADTIIFPEVFSKEKLEKWRKRLGAYLFSCQFLNNPTAPEDADFKESDVRWFGFINDVEGQWIHHEVVDGIVWPNLKPSAVDKVLVTDPAHAGQAGTNRCRHAICVVGQSVDDNIYLLDTWAQASNYDVYFDKLYEMAKKHRIRKVGFETVAAQKFAAYHLMYRNRYQDWKLKLIELKGEVEGPDGEMTRKKEWRIRTIIGPILESNKLWLRREQQDFLGELSTFPRGRFVDQLDAFAYAPQLLKRPVDFTTEQAMLARNAADAAKVGQRYCVTVN
jgi:hypothetical protein